MLTDKQRNVLIELQTNVTSDQINDWLATASTNLTKDDLIKFITVCNAFYRIGEPIVSDSYYDHALIKRLIEIDPDHPFLNQVEIESPLGKTVDLPALMLSTNKAYSEAEIKQWAFKVQMAAKQVNINVVIVKVTPKLDGFACYDDGEKLYTRGNGVKGSDVSHILERGVVVKGQRGLGPGEIVVSKSYFSEHLIQHYVNSRNFQGSVIREHDIDERVKQACLNEAIVFYPFSLLPKWEGLIDDFIKDRLNIINDIWASVDYDVDGVVIEVIDEAIKNHMGHTNHHHRWQIAFKRNEESVEATVIDVVAQTGKTGCITPVAIIEPIQVSGATVQRVTAHNYGHVLKWKLGIGSKIQIIRSGLVIPKIINIITEGAVHIPTECPSCHGPVGWENDSLYCYSTNECPAQLNQTLQYFFETLGNLDGFGPKTIEKITQHGVTKISEIYGLTLEQFKAMGFGSGESANLIKALDNSRKIEIEDWRFLAAFNIFRLGKGGCRLLLQHVPLLDIFKLTKDDLLVIKGIGPVLAETIISCLKKIELEFHLLYKMNFSLKPTSLINVNNNIVSSIKDKIFVITGTLAQPRQMYENVILKKGAKLNSSVTSKTNYLVIGDNPGQSKIIDSKKYNTQILNESEFYNLINR